MKLLCSAIFLLLLRFVGISSADVVIGLGMDYTPIAKLEYVNNPDADFEIVDNIDWQARGFYGFGNGLRAGLFFDYYRKRIHPAAFTTDDLSKWGIGLLGDYGYEITESGNTQLVGGMETGYGELTDKESLASMTAGSIWVAGLAGVRFVLTYNIWLEFDYRLSWLEFELNGPIPKKYLFSGSSLRLSLEYPFGSESDGKEEK
jgi:hypothetical protein